MTVVVTGGDGDGYGIGLNHFIQAMRRNINVTYIVMDNEIYGLTTGQASPTTETGITDKDDTARESRGHVESAGPRACFRLRLYRPRV